MKKNHTNLFTPSLFTLSIYEIIYAALFKDNQDRYSMTLKDNNTKFRVNILFLSTKFRDRYYLIS